MCRELAYVRGENEDSQFFIRHKAYESLSGFKTDFLNDPPWRMEIGPFYNRRLVTNAKDFFGIRSVGKELIFGILILYSFRY